MKPLLQHIFSIIFLALACQVQAQDTTADTTTTTASPINTGPGFYVDYGKLLTIPTDFETKLEAGIAWRMKNRFSPNLQIGRAKLEPKGAFANGNYLSKGVYARIGVDYLIPFDATHLLYIGAKYGMSQFEESGNYEIGSLLWDSYADSFNRIDLSASWFEIILGSEKTLNEYWSAGGYFSLRILSDRKKFDPIDTYAIPGYGRAFDKTIPAVNVYIRFTL